MNLLNIIGPCICDYLAESFLSLRILSKKILGFHPSIILSTTNWSNAETGTLITGKKPAAVVRQKRIIFVIHF